MLRRYPSRFKFTWASSRWLFSSAISLVAEEKRKIRAAPRNSIPITATAVKAMDRII